MIFLKFATYHSCSSFHDKFLAMYLWRYEELINDDFMFVSIDFWAHEFDQSDLIKKTVLEIASSNCLFSRHFASLFGQNSIWLDKLYD